MSGTPLGVSRSAHTQIWQDVVAVLRGESGSGVHAQKVGSVATAEAWSEEPYEALIGVPSNSVSGCTDRGYAHNSIGVLGSTAMGQPSEGEETVPMKYDLIVIGAGPAGCVAASTAASKGLTVLVLEKRELGWEKPCAGGISPRGVTEFKIPQKVFDRYAGNVYLCSPSAKGVMIDLKGAKGGLCMRASLDSWLVNQARERGAEFREKTTVTTPITSGGAVVGVKAKTSGTASAEFRANVVVAADGTPSNFARKVGVFDARNVGAQATCYQYQMAMSDEKISNLVGDCIELYFGSKWCTGGYSWIFPKKDVVSVGNIAWMDQVTKHNLNLKDLLDGFIKTHPVASKKLVSAKVLYPQAHMIGFWGIVKKHVGNGYLIIGDAGGFVSYVTGEGVYYSMKAGQYAAETVVEASEKAKFTEEALSSFNGLVDKSPVGGDMTSGLPLRQMFLEDDAKQEMSISTAQKDPKFADMIGGVIAGLVPYKMLAPSPPAVRKKAGEKEETKRRKRLAVVHHKKSR